jgi:hypothetical protein
MSCPSTATNRARTCKPDRSRQLRTGYFPVRSRSLSSSSPPSEGLFAPPLLLSESPSSNGFVLVPPVPAAPGRAVLAYSWSASLSRSSGMRTSFPCRKTTTSAPSMRTKSASMVRPDRSVQIRAKEGVAQTSSGSTVSSAHHRCNRVMNVLSLEQSMKKRMPSEANLSNKKENAL